MSVTPLCLPALLLFTGISMTTAQNSIRLHLEMYTNGALLGNPEVSLTPGSTGRLDINGVGTIAFTPTFRTSDTVGIAFDINVGGRHLDPVIQIGRDHPGSASWSSSTGKEAFRFTVSWVR